VTSALLVACSGETAVPIDPDNPLPAERLDPAAIPAPNVTHSLTPTPQMEQLARQQCLEDNTLDQGFVQAVDPESGEILAEFTLDCAQVRNGE
jgi:hypothetical protein